MFDFQGRVLAEVEALGKATDFLPRISAVMGRESVLSRMSEEEAAHLAGFMPCYRAPAGMLLIREGDASGIFVFVIEGRIEISKQRADGGKAVLASIGPGETLGEMTLVDAKPRSADCRVVEPATFAVLDRSILDLLKRQDHALVIKLLTPIILILSERLRQTSDTLCETLH